MSSVYETATRTGRTADGRGQVITARAGKRAGRLEFREERTMAAEWFLPQTVGRELGPLELGGAPAQSPSSGWVAALRPAQTLP